MLTATTHSLDIYFTMTAVVDVVGGDSELGAFQSIASALTSAAATSGGGSVLGTALAAASLGSFVVDIDSFTAPESYVLVQGGAGGTDELASTDAYADGMPLASYAIMVMTLTCMLLSCACCMVKYRKRSTPRRTVRGPRGGVDRLESRQGNEGNEGTDPFERQHRAWLDDRVRDPSGPSGPLGPLGTLGPLGPLERSPGVPSAPAVATQITADEAQRLAPRLCLVEGRVRGGTTVSTTFVFS